VLTVQKTHANHTSTISDKYIYIVYVAYQCINELHKGSV